MTNKQKEKLNNLLRIAAQKGDVKGIKTVLSAGADIETKLDIINGMSNTPLLSAIYFNHSEAAMALIEANANVNALNSKELTPLMLAASQGMNDICVKLIARGASIDQKSGEGRTSLIIAAKRGHSDVCLTLLAAGADIEMESDSGAPDASGEGTALIYAVGHGHIEVCRRLIEKGANVNARDDMNRAALGIAADKEARSIAIVLMRAGANEGDYVYPKLKEWRKEMQESVKAIFSADMAPSVAQCFTFSQINDAVLDACAVGEFGSLVGEPLIKARQYELFQKIWDELPEIWRDQNQGIYIGYVKREKELTPAIHSQAEGRVQI